MLVVMFPLYHSTVTCLMFWLFKKSWLVSSLAAVVPAVGFIFTHAVTSLYLSQLKSVTLSFLTHTNNPKGRGNYTLWFCPLFFALLPLTKYKKEQVRKQQFIAFIMQKIKRNRLLRCSVPVNVTINKQKKFAFIY